MSLKKPPSVLPGSRRRSNRVPAGELREGDEIMASYGRFVRVAKLSPQGEKVEICTENGEHALVHRSQMVAIGL